LNAAWNDDFGLELPGIAIRGGSGPACMVVRCRSDNLSARLINTSRLCLDLQKTFGLPPQLQRSRRSASRRTGQPKATAPSVMKQGVLMPISALFANGNIPNIVVIIADQQRALQYWPTSFIEDHQPSLYALQ